MISVIVCSRYQEALKKHQKNITQSADCEIEYVHLDNSQGKMGICEAYNRGVEQAKGDVLLFVHEDVFFLENGWGKALEEKFGCDAELGILGLAGTQYLAEDHPLWVRAGRPWIWGEVVHSLADKRFKTVYGNCSEDVDVVAVDGLFMAVRRSLFYKIQWDEKAFDRFHFYDLDLCMQALSHTQIRVTCDIKVEHQSGGAFNEEWIHYGTKFLEKWKGDLPKLSKFCQKAPTLPNPNTFENVDL